MKTFILTVMAFSAVNAFANNGVAIGEAPRTSSYLRTQRADLCSFWTSIRDANGGFAYACSSFPMSYSLVDGDDAQRVISALERRIEDLEARIATLEKSN